MDYQSLGGSGLKISKLSFGAWVTFGFQMGVDKALDCMAAAFDGGANFFDNAEVYAGGEAETIMGQALKKAGWGRSEYLVSTKIFWGGKGPNQRGLSRKHIVEGTNDALARFQLDYVDLLYCHRPDIHTPIEETVRAMNHVIDQGKALYWGTSEWSAQQITEACEIAKRNGLIAPIVEQPQYHMFHRERVEVEYAPLYERYGLGTTTWSPLASGLLTGKYNDGVPDDSRLALEDYAWLRDAVLGPEGQKNIEKVRTLSNIASDLDASLAQLAIAWCAKNPHVSSVITGASRPEQVRENMKAIHLLEKLTPEVMGRIEEILDNKPSTERDWRD